MEIKELLEFIEIEDKRLKEKYEKDSENKKTVLLRTIKLSEEIGELCSEILAFNSIQRKQKLEKFKLEKLEEEFADVIITSLLLGKSLNIDFEKSIKKSIEKVNKRYKPKN